MAHTGKLRAPPPRPRQCCRLKTLLRHACTCTGMHAGVQERATTGASKCSLQEDRVSRRHVYTRVRTCLYTFRATFLHRSVHMWTHMPMCAFLQTCTNVYAHVYEGRYRRAHMCVHVSMGIHLQSRTHVYAHAYAHAFADLCTCLYSWLLNFFLHLSACRC